MSRGLFHKGFHYYQHKKSKNKIWYRCEEFNKGCKGWAVVDNGVISITRLHNHPPDPFFLDLQDKFTEK